jgi:hypothetical protein
MKWFWFSLGLLLAGMLVILYLWFLWSIKEVMDPEDLAASDPAASSARVGLFNQEEYKTYAEQIEKQWQKRLQFTVDVLPLEWVIDAQLPLAWLISVESSALYLLWYIRQRNTAFVRDRPDSAGNTTNLIQHLMYMLDGKGSQTNYTNIAIDDSTSNLHTFHGVKPNVSVGLATKKLYSRSVCLAYPWYYGLGEGMVPMTARQYPSWTAVHEAPALEWTFWILYTVWEYTQAVTVSEDANRNNYQAWVLYHVRNLNEVLMHDIAKDPINGPHYWVMYSGLPGTDSTALYQPHTFEFVGNENTQRVDRGSYTHLHENLMWLLLLERIYSTMPGPPAFNGLFVDKDQPTQSLQPASLTYVRFKEGVKELLRRCTFKSFKNAEWIAKLNVCSCFKPVDVTAFLTTDVAQAHQYLYWGLFKCSADHGRLCAPQATDTELETVYRNTEVTNCSPAPVKTLFYWHQVAERVLDFTPLDEGIVQYYMENYTVLDADLPHGCNARVTKGESDVTPCAPAAPGFDNTPSAPQEKLRYGFRYSHSSDGMHWPTTIQMAWMIHRRQVDQEITAYEKVLHNIQTSLQRYHEQHPDRFLVGAYRRLDYHDTPVPYDMNTEQYLIPEQQAVRATFDNNYKSKAQEVQLTTQISEGLSTANATIGGPFAASVPSSLASLWQRWWYHDILFPEKPLFAWERPVV